MTSRLYAFVLAALLSAPFAVRAQASEPFCVVPDELIADESGLPAVARAVAAGEPLKIVAVGSATTSGMGASSPDASYPARLEVHLRTLMPGRVVFVTNRGAPKQSAADMVQRFKSDVLIEKPALVIWETGTADAVRGVDGESFLLSLKSGLKTARDAGADVLLVDPQYSARLSGMVNLAPYMDTMSKLASKYDLVTFHRYEVMRYLTEAGKLSIDDAPPAKRTEQIDAIYDCMGQLMARMIAAAAGPR
jgi:acyl-CoA thioesterase I